MTARPEPQTVAIAAHKGGVGKTTTAMALAAGLARFHAASVLLVDLDPQGHSTVGLGVDVDDDRTVREIFAETAVPGEIIGLEHRTSVPGLRVVPATIRLERVARTLLARTRREDVLKRALEPVEAYDWVILDCPPSLGPLVENALVAADRVIVPCRMEARATDGIVDLVEVLQLLRPSFDDWRILRTQRDARATVTNAAIDGALDAWASRLLSTIIPKSEALNQAQIDREDIYTFSARCAGAVAYSRLCEEVRAWAAVSVG